MYRFNIQLCWNIFEIYIKESVHHETLNVFLLILSDFDASHFLHCIEYV